MNFPVSALTPLHPSQEEVYRDQVMDSDSPHYNIGGYTTLVGDINKGAFKAAVKSASGVFDVFRLKLRLSGEKPMCEFLSEADIIISELDFSVGIDPKALALQWMQERFNKAFNLEKGPLFEQALLKISTGEFWWFGRFHHLILDGYGFAVYTKYIADKYSSLVTGRDYMGEFPFYNKEIITAGEYQGSKAYENDRSYWMEQFREVPQPLLKQRSADVINETESGSVEIDIPARLQTILKDISVKTNCSLQQLTIAAFTVYFGNTESRQDLVLGIPVHNRKSRRERNIVGMFSGMIPCRCSYAPGQTVEQLLAEVRSRQRNDYRHQSFPISHLNKNLNLFIDNRHQVFDIVVNYANLDFALHFENMQATTFDLSSENEQSPFNFWWRDYGHQQPLQVCVKFQYAYFSKEEASHLVHRILFIMESFQTALNKKLSDMSVVPFSEAQLLQSYNNTTAHYPAGKTLIEIFAEQVIANPHQVAVCYEGEQITYRGLDESSNRLAHYLRKLGVTQETLVPICMERCIELVIGIIGILKAGGAYVPIDTAYPAERVLFMVQDTSAAVALAITDSMHLLPQREDFVTIDIKAEWQKIKEESADYPIDKSNANNLAYVIYTSGSTGRPKGVMVEHGSLLNFIYWHIGKNRLSPASRSTVMLGISFDPSASEIFSGLLSGASLYIINNKLRLEVDSLLSFYQKNGITHAHIPTALIPELVTSKQPEGLKLEYVQTGGEQLKGVDTSLVSYKIVNHYGPTENTIVTTYYTLPGSACPALPPIGKPIANTEVYIFNSMLQLQPQGVPGELYVGGAQLARGYLNMDELTVKKFIAHPFKPGERLYRTGDICRWLADGNMEFLARLDEQVKIRGHRIEPGEIENVLQQAAGVSQCVVIAREDSYGHKRLLGYVVNGAGYSREEAKAFLRERLPEYMVPSFITELKELPVTPNGKIDKKALPGPDMYMQQTNGYVAARNDTEAQLVNIWQGLLSQARIGIYDNFFEMGGDSIIAIQVVSRARQAGLFLKPADLFQHQTVASLAGCTNTEKSIQGEAGVLTGEAGLSPIQQWFFQQEFEAYNHYNQSILLQLDKAVPAGILSKAIQRITTHHDALRFRYYRQNDNTWIQEYGNREAIVEICDLTYLSITSLATTIQNIAESYQQKMDIEAGKLLQAVLFRTPGNASHNRLFIAIHHLAIDAVSWRIILEDLEHLLTSFMKNGDGFLADKSGSYRQWVNAVKQHSQTKTIEAGQGYWHSILSAGSTFPAGNTCEKLLLKDTNVYSTCLPAPVTESLLKQANMAYNTAINDLLLAALAKTVTGWSGSDKLLIALEGHGREDLTGQVDISRTVGWFTNLYPVLLHIGGIDSPAELIKSVKEQLRMIPGKGAGFGLLKYLHPSEEVRHTFSDLDYVDIVFNYLGQVDNAISTGSWLGMAEEEIGQQVSGSNEFKSKLEINSSVSQGKLIMAWRYCGNEYQQQTIKDLADAYIENLTLFVGHCLQKKISEKTPSDYGLTCMDFRELDKFLNATKNGISRSENISSLYNLTPLQEGMLFHGLYNESSVAYIEQFSCDLFQPEINKLKLAWNHLLKTHSILRTAFYHKQLPVPIQCVHKFVALPFEVVDYTALPVGEQMEKLEIFMEDDKSRGFDFEQAPLMRVTIIRLSETSCRMLWTSHHILLDGWSMPVLMQELLGTYELLVNNLIPAEVKEDRYEDFINYLGASDKNEEELFWKQYLNKLEAPSLLPFTDDKETRNKGGKHFKEQQLLLDESFTRLLNEFAHKNRLTINTLMQGAWSILLSAYTGNSEVVYGVTVSGRPAGLEKAEQRVGLYINTIPFCASLSDDCLVADWLKSLQEGHSKARDFQHTSLASVQQWQGVAGDLFDSLLIFENYPMGEVLSKQWMLQPSNLRMEEQTNYLLSITVCSGQQLKIRFGYNAELVSDEDIRHVRGHFKQVLTQMIFQQDITCGGFQLLTNDEKQLFESYNDTSIAYPTDKTVVDLFEEQAAVTPDNIAVSFEGEQLSYRELDEKSSQLANYLKIHGVGEETLVPVCMDRCPEMIIGIMGILKAGGAYVPIDPAYPKERIAYMVEDTSAKIAIAITASRFLLPQKDNLTIIDIQKEWPSIQQQPTNKDQRPTPKAHRSTNNDQQSTNNGQRSPNCLAYVIYTSGSTGRPKGVMVEHGSLINRLLWAQDYHKLGTKDTVLQKTTFCFDVSVWELLWPLLVGSKLVFARPGGQKDSRYLISLIEKENITTTHFVPSMLEIFLQEIKPGNCKTLKTVICSGEALTVAQAILFREKMGGARLYNLYGPTEAAIDVSYWQLPEQGPLKVIPIGKPVSNTKLYILDKSERQVPAGVAGELYIGGVQVARGYLNREGLTKERFITDRFSGSKGARLYRTGDLARWMPDGNVAYLGRIDDQVKIRGYRIEPGEIEIVLLQAPGVRQCVVLAKVDANSGISLTGYVITSEDYNKEEVKIFLRSRLPEYMLPAAFIELKELPLTTNGKIDKKALPEADGSSFTMNRYVAPVTVTEQKLAAIWKQLLNIERAGVQDNFFELGGHSLLATRMVSFIIKEFEIVIPINTIFKFTRIAELARYLDAVLALSEPKEIQNDAVEFQLIEI